MVGLNPLMNNVTIIHLPGKSGELQTKSSIETQNNNRKLQYPAENEIHTLFEKKNEGSLGHINENKISNGEINDQNVGISGGIEMLSEPASKYFQISEGFDDMIGPYSLLSVHESIIETLTSSHHFTTITIGERNESENNNKKIMSSSKSFVLNPPKDKNLKSFENMSDLKNVTTSNPSLSLSTQTDVSKNQDKLIKKPQMENKQIQVALDWQLSHELITCPNLISVAKDERDSERGSTPSSFSSAYTVTEQEMVTSDVTTSTDAQSDTSSSAGENESQSSDESSTEGKRITLSRRNVSYVFISKSSDNNQSEKRSDNPYRFVNHLGEELYVSKSLLPSFRLRKNSYDSQSSEGSSTGGQLPYQRDKEDDEMWVANEATYSCSLSDYTLQWLSPPILPQWEADSELEQKSLQNQLLSVVIEEQLGVGVTPGNSEAMTTFICPVSDTSSLQRKHFANRQRVVDSVSDIVNEKDSEEKDPFWNKENENKEGSGTILTSTSNNRPTKRFSFLIRSNSIKDVGVTTNSEMSVDKKMPRPAEVSASDRAILDRLSQLNLEKSSNVTRPRNQPNPKQPLCGRCGEPVYPKEAVRPTSDLFYHSSCLKCFHCGLRLTIGTFYRYPVKTNDTRIYCRSHLPAPDGRPTNTDLKTDLPSREIIKCDSVGLRYF